MERVPDDYDAMKELLKYGLLGTDARVLAALGQRKSKVPFIVKAADQEFDGEEERKERQRNLEEALDFERYINKCETAVHREGN